MVNLPELERLLAAYIATLSPDGPVGITYARDRLAVKLVRAAPDLLRLAREAQEKDRQLGDLQKQVAAARELVEAVEQEETWRVAQETFSHCDSVDHHGMQGWCNCRHVCCASMYEALAATSEASPT